MRPEMLDRIVDKATTECRVVGIYLYNWTEPLLHPRLAEMIRVVQGHGVPCGLSTNLNVMPNLDAVMEANPHMLKVSLSGFTQETYGVTHRRGDIEVVKRNMAEVARAKARSGATTRLVVAFHRYLGNHEDEDRMSALCESLGFEFEPAWAYLMPFEKMLAFADPAAADVRLTDDDHALIDPFGAAARRGGQGRETRPEPALRAAGPANGDHRSGRCHAVLHGLRPEQVQARAVPRYAVGGVAGDEIRARDLRHLHE